MTINITASDSWVARSQARTLPLSDPLRYLASQKQCDSVWHLPSKTQYKTSTSISINIVMQLLHFSWDRHQSLWFEVPWNSMASRGPRCLPDVSQVSTRCLPQKSPCPGFLSLVLVHDSLNGFTKKLCLVPQSTDKAQLCNNIRVLSMYHTPIEKKM